MPIGWAWDGSVNNIENCLIGVRFPAGPSTIGVF
jgi:hypothetical protein